MRRNKPTKLRTDAGQEKKGEINWYLRGHVLLQHLRKGENGKVNETEKCVFTWAGTAPALGPRQNPSANPPFPRTNRRSAFPPVLYYRSSSSSSLIYCTFFN